MRIGRGIVAAIGSVAWVLTAETAANAQSFAWDSFEDLESPSLCEVVNAANAELVVLSDTGQLMIISGSVDNILADTFVDEDLQVFFEDDFVGFIEFANDGDDFRTLWWTSLTGRVVEVDGFTGEPFETDSFPEDYFDVPCDACELRPDDSQCVDPVPRPPVFSFCGAGLHSAMVMTFAGLALMGLSRRRLL